MEAQLRLLSTPEPVTPARRDADDDAPLLEPGTVMWRLSASTRALGRQGIEQARAELHRARPTDDEAGDGVAEHQHHPSAA